MNALGIDIGGSSLKGAPVNTRTGKLLADRLRVATPEKLTPAQMAAVVSDIVRHFDWRGRVGIGFPGVIHGPRIRTSANLHPDFIGCDGVRLFSRAAGQPVALTNDAAAAGMAEMTFGVGRNFAGKVLLLTLGTGVGSVLAYRGVVVPCEFGHLHFKGGDAEKSRGGGGPKEKPSDSGSTGTAAWIRFLRVLENALWPEFDHHRRRDQRQT